MYILIVRNNDNPQALDASLTLSAYFGSQDIDSSFVDSSTLYSDSRDNVLKSFANIDPDLAVVLGGDGTILHTAHLLKGKDCPILGINFGNLGFLANDSNMGLLDLVSRALAGELIEDRRCVLEIELELNENQDADAIMQPCDSPEARSSESCKFGVLDSALEGRRKFFALNEAVITRGSLGRTITYTLDISGNQIGDVSGDGVILATATGSTAYSLAAGGPLVNPSYSGMIVQPLAPHTLTARAVLTDPSDVVCIDLTKTREGRHATLFLDGDLVLLPAPVEKVYARTSDDRVTLLYASRDHFYKYAAKTFFDK